jgi:hypothetical protein
MSAVAASETTGRLEGTAGPWIGVAITYLGFAAIVVSAAWTTQPLPQVTAGSKEHYFTALLGAVLVAAGAIGRARLARRVAGKLLCALGAAVCLSHSLDPMLETIPAIAAHMPRWLADSYPGLATIGWIVAALGGLIWWAGGAVDVEAGLFRRVAVTVTLLLLFVTWGVRQALVAAGYEVPLYGSQLIAWRIVEIAATLVVAMSVSGERRFAHWPMLLFGLGLLAHSARSFLPAPPA